MHMVHLCSPIKYQQYRYMWYSWCRDDLFWPKVMFFSYLARHVGTTRLLPHDFCDHCGLLYRIVSYNSNTKRESYFEVLTKTNVVVLRGLIYFQHLSIPSLGPLIYHFCWTCKPLIISYNYLCMLSLSYFDFIYRLTNFLCCDIAKAHPWTQTDQLVLWPFLLR